MMPASEHETAGVLSSAEIQQFIQDGFVRIDRAFPRQLADEGRAILWRDLPCEPDDPASWTRPVIRLCYYDHEPLNRAGKSSLLFAPFDQLLWTRATRPPPRPGNLPPPVA